MTRVENSLLRTLLWMTTGAAAAIPALVVPQPDDPLLTTVVHLSLLVAFSIGLAFHLAPLADDPWFPQLPMGEAGRAALSGVAVIVMATGATGLVTLATSAALRYDPSLQFLQMLSALDIAWAAAAIVFGLRRYRGPSLAVAGSLLLGVVCVWSIWRYLDTVGFAPDGGWIVRASELNRLVLPFDMGAAVVAVAAFTLGVRKGTGA